MEVADKTGVSDTFAFQNMTEMEEPFYVPDPSDISEIAPPEVPPDRTPSPPQIRARTKEDQGIFERMFGYNPEEDLPWGYENMSPLHRKVFQAQLAAQNIATRTALGATKQVAGSLQLVLPESMEQYLPTDTRLNPNRLQEDKFYEARIQSELRKKRDNPRELGLSDLVTGDTQQGLTPDEEEKLAYLDSTLPSNRQSLPEFVGRVAGEVERIALAGQIFKAIPLSGGTTLNSHLSEVGRRTLGEELTKLLPKVVDKPIITIGLNTLIEGVTELGPAAGELFTWGAISAEKDEKGEADRIKSGIKMTPWATVILFKVPIVMAGKTKAGQVTSGFMKRVVARVAAPIADKLAKMQAGKAKKQVVNQGVLAADDIFVQENGRAMTVAERKTVKKVLEEVTDETTKIVKESTDDIVAKIESMAGKELGQNPVGAESVIPKAMRSVETVGDDVINSTTALVEKRTGLVTIQQGGGKYAVLDGETLQELAVNIPRNKIGSALEQIIEGKKFNVKGAKQVAKRKLTPRVIAEEAELKRSLKRMEVATNKAFRAGVKKGVEREAVKIQAGKERLQTVIAGNRKQWENVEFARQLVKDFVPKADQHLFMQRLIKAKTEGGLDKIFDDIGKHLDRAKVRNSVDSIRGALKDASKKYKDKTGKFAKAPDSIKPILESLDKTMSGVTKLDQTAGVDIGQFGQLADDMVDGLNSALSGKGEILGIPEGLADDLYSLTVKRGDKITADEIETLANLTRMVLHRAEQSHLIDIGGEVMAASNAIADSSKRIIPRPIKAAKTKLSANVNRLLGADSDHPVTLVGKMFGENSNMATLLDDLYEGEVKAFGVMRNSYQIVKDYMTKNNLDDGVFNGLKKKVSVTINGQSVKITRDDLLGMAMSTRDPWVFDQMTRTSGYNIKGIGKTGDTAAASLDELGEMFAKLTPEEMKLGGMMFELNNNYLSQIVNETSMRLNGAKIATYPQYYPSHRKLNKKLYGNKFGQMTAETQSNFMPRMGGKGRMRFNPYSRELMDYIQNSAMYHGTSMPMRSIKTVMADKGLQAALDNGGYGIEKSNFIDILGRSEGMYSDSSVLDAIGSGILNRFTKGVLGGRVSTIGTQMASVPAAKSVIPPKYFSIVDKVKRGDALDDLMQSDFFWHRWTGRRVSVELGDTASKSSLDHFIFNKTPLTEKPLSGLVWGDKRAVEEIYLAARRFVTDTTTLQGDDLTRAAVKWTEKATRETQPNWSVLTRSKLASDPSVFRRSLTMFRTAQEAQFNIWKRANIKFARSGGKQKDIDALSDSYLAVIESQMSVAIWKTTWKRMREAGVAGGAAWLGIYTPEDEYPFAEDLVKNAARSVAGMVPLGQLMETAVEGAYDQLFNEGVRFNLSNDPITTVTTASVAAVDSLAKWTKKWMEKEVKREGFTVDLVPATVEDILSQISTSDADRAQKKRELINQLSKDVVKALRTAGMVAGLPVGPLDEWAAPGLKRSQFSQVNRISHKNSSNPAELQRDLHKFLTIQARLQKKSDKKGLTQEEATLAVTMNAIKSGTIDPVFAVDDVVGDTGDRVLDSASEIIALFLKENKKEVSKVIK